MCDEEDSDNNGDGEAVAENGAQNNKKRATSEEDDVLRQTWVSIEQSLQSRTMSDMSNQEASLILHNTVQNRLKWSTVQLSKNQVLV